ncbi:FAD-dependent monooxygenase [Colletotrichum sp. SAR 10_65]|nr:FAD-dependent monooxygenase [Colletotrichum sp. SAR 10_65]KAJ5001438.1 FAD-dependent monooxygenase [Colletotrichum sp. SAR 10_66]
MSRPFAIIVGAGPCGLLLVLLLAKAGLEVQLVDAGNELDDQPRATHYGPEAVEQLDRAGVLSDVLAQGFIPHGVAWRKPSGEVIAELPTTTLTTSVKHPLICLPLNHLGRILHDHLLKQPQASILWGHRVTHTYYPFDKYGFTDSNFIISREHWYMAARISNDGLWRVTYGEVPGLTKTEYLERQAWKFEVMLPGNPKADEWRCVNFSPYKIHQRLAPSLRQGKVLLAGDAAHSNMRRLCKRDPDKVLEEDTFLQLINESKHNPEVAAQLSKASKGLSHDFTQYYK